MSIVAERVGEDYGLPIYNSNITNITIDTIEAIRSIASRLEELHKETGLNILAGSVEIKITDSDWDPRYYFLERSIETRIKITPSDVPVRFGLMLKVRKN